jgi:hypothetical protein
MTHDHFNRGLEGAHKDHDSKATPTYSRLGHGVKRVTQMGLVGLWHMVTVVRYCKSLSSPI